MAILGDRVVQAGGNPNGHGIGISKDIWKGYQSNNTSHVFQGENICRILGELFTENVAAKMVRAARNGLKNNNPPQNYPEWVPQDGEAAGVYELREASFWTCGFFPGTLYSLLERATRYPQAFQTGYANKSEVRLQLLSLARTWTGPIYEMAKRTDTHDMSFIVQPSLRVEWELFGTEEAATAIFTAAESLASRYNPTAKAIRSWDGLFQNGREIKSMEEDFLVIIDSMMNLDLLFYAGNHLSSQHLIDIAVTHAQTVARAILRPEKRLSVTLSPYEGSLYSTFHVVNISPVTGDVKQRMTAQGYADHTTWARGQAWGIFGYAQTYHWTKDARFLEISCGLAEYFIAQLEESPACVERQVLETDSKPLQRQRTTKGRYVPLWDFDAPIDESVVLRDSSAGVIAANGMLLLYQALIGLGQDVLARWYLDMAITIVEDTLALSLAHEKASFSASVSAFSADGHGRDVAVENVTDQNFDAILKNATANYNARDRRRYWDHGLVYADYYFVEFGNRLLRLGLA